MIEVGDLFTAIGVDQTIEVIDIFNKIINKNTDKEKDVTYLRCIIIRNGFKGRHKLEIESASIDLLRKECYIQTKK